MFVCDDVVMFVCLCHPVLVQLLRSGGVALLDDLSLAKQCKIGDNVVTWGHDLLAKCEFVCSTDRSADVALTN